MDFRPKLRGLFMAPFSSVGASVKPGPIHNDAFVLVVKTGMYRVHRYWLKGDRAGQSEV